MTTVSLSPFTHALLVMLGKAKQPFPDSKDTRWSSDATLAYIEPNEGLAYVTDLVLKTKTTFELGDTLTSKRYAIAFFNHSCAMTAA